MISTTQQNITQVFEGNPRNVSDQVVVEEPLEIKIVFGAEGKRVEQSLSVTMRTPTQDNELVIGFLFTEGIIQSADQIQSFHLPQENQLIVELKSDVAFDPEMLKRNFYTTSSCGVCGKASIDAVVRKNFKKVGDGLIVSAPLIYTLSDKLLKAQNLFEHTGGLHASALFDKNGELAIIREDVGRHNALDKVIGAMLTKKLIPLSDYLLMVSGRISFELVQKAALAGVPLLIGVGAASSLAIELANETGMTLIGFLRDQKFNIYTNPQRIKM